MCSVKLVGIFESKLTFREPKLHGLKMYKIDI